MKLRDLIHGDWVTVWQAPNGAAVDISSCRIFSPELERTLFRTNHVRLELDCSVSNSYCELDAVELVGKKFSVDVVNSEEKLAEDLSKLLRTGEFCDIRFEIDGKQISAHRNILAMRSEYFRELLCENIGSDRHSKPIHLDNISFEAFNSLLVYFYTNSIDNETTCLVACELMRISDWYNLSDLKRIAQQYVQKKLCIDNVVPILVNAMTVEPKLDEIEEICLRFATKNFVLLIERDDFKSLPQFILIRITQFYAENYYPIN